MTKTSKDKATQYIIDGKLHIDGVHCEFYPFMLGHLDVLLQEVDLLVEESTVDKIGEISFKLYHLRNNPNGVQDLKLASEFSGDGNTYAVDTFLDFLKVHDKEGLSDITSSVVVIEGFEVEGANAHNNFYSKALRKFLDHMVFLNVDFIVVAPPIKDIAKQTHEEAKWTRIYNGLGFFAFTSKGTQPIFVHNEILKLEKEIHI